MAEPPSIVCPVCFTRQPNAWFCAVCGKALHDLPKHLPVETPALEELELTVVAKGPINVAVVPMEGLEPTHHTAAVSSPGSLGEGMPTAFREAPEVPAESVPGFESTQVVAPSAPTPYGPVACRICGTPWNPGASVVCDRCGVRIPVPDAYLRSREEATGVEARAACPTCGTGEQVAGGRCAACGATIPPAE